MLSEAPPSHPSLQAVPEGGRGNAPRPRRTHRHYWPRLILALTALSCATRIPSFARPLWNPDEGYLAVQARMLAHGGTLYETVVDRKPPLVPWLYEAVFALFGSDSLTPVRVCAVVAHVVTAVFLASLARGRWGDTAGRTAGVLYLVLSVGLNPEDTQAATFEVFMLPWTAAALWCADRRRWVLCGTAVAAAFLTKQTGGAVLVPVVWMLWRAGLPRSGVLRCAVGAFAPVAAVALLTNPAGFVFWTVTGSGAYASITGSELHVLLRGLTNAAILSLACVGVLPPVVRVLRIARTGCGELWLWLASSAGAVVFGFHFFGHYYLQLVPPLALLGTLALHILPREHLRRSLLVTACCGALFVTWGLLAPRTELAHAERVAAALRERAGPDDRVLVWGMHPETYWLSNRTPASRFLTAGLLTNFSGGRDGGGVGERFGVPGSWTTFRTEVRGRPPTVIVDDSRGEAYGPGRVGSVRRLLAGYREVARVDGAVVYERVRAT
ncbi:ArnT family glycosyltransferase [Streptomyces endophyticus]|uniref:Glycosyltransferase family 39 protein n=1 Tax=Streptomyces endophyticus TaxID=714166 RepID=A0ABU6FG85_9ACTN|nr:glycosyltransferase family 39 protein [Streptomyces endophyticus]MEB8343060.1 glycosyltransferase family 39 protein [Streptomyces endophyticus]